MGNPRQLRELLYGDRTGLEKFNDFWSRGAAAADAWTWGKLWNACEWQVAGERKGLAAGSEAFYQETARLFAQVIDQTQVVDGVLQRSQIMRSPDSLPKMATSFMGEPIMSLNLLLRSWDAYRYEQDGDKRKAALEKLGRAAAALLATDIVNALAQCLVDAAREDDKEKKYWERFWSAFWGPTEEEESPWEAGRWP